MHPAYDFQVPDTWRDYTRARPGSPSLYPRTGRAGDTVQSPTVRYCTCGTRLARDNPGERCASCLRTKPALMSPSAPEVSPEFWEHPAMRAALASRHMGKVIREFRHHP